VTLVRIALGASRRSILSLVLGKGLALTLCGFGVGAVASIGLSRLLSNLVFDVGLADPVTLLGGPTLLAAVAFVASYLPARRATYLDPVETLRGD